MSIEEKLARLDESFQKAAEHVLSKNAELYKRLSECGISQWKKSWFFTLA